MVTSLLIGELFSFYLSFMSVSTMRCILTPVMNVEACVAEWLTPRTLDLEVRGSSLRRRVVLLDEELFSTLSLFIQVYKWVPGTYCWGVTLRWTIEAQAVWAFGSCAPVSFLL